MSDSKQICISLIVTCRTQDGLFVYTEGRSPPTKNVFRWQMTEEWAREFFHEIFNFDATTSPLTPGYVYLRYVGYYEDNETVSLIYRTEIYDTIQTSRGEWTMVSPEITNPHLLKGLQLP